MVIVDIVPSLKDEILKKFKKDSIKIFEFLLSLEKNPKKGKPLGRVGNIVIKELKYEGYRFYFITDNYKIRFYKIEEMTDLLLRFVRMSNKKEQQNTISEIRDVLLKMGPRGFK